MKQYLISTRDPNKKKYTLREAIRTSQPADKGLFCFNEWPQISKEELCAWEPYSYGEVAYAVLSKFDFGLSQEQLEALIHDTYGAQWDTEEIVPVRAMKPGAYLMELFHGPTQAFKDCALQFLPRLLAAYRAEGETLCALGASSGDTISAAHFGVGGVEGLRSVFLLPEEGPSHIQRLQAVSHGFDNVMTILIKGNFDDGQRIIKTILTDPNYEHLRTEHHFVTFNSINIARILAQVVYYVWAYLRVHEYTGAEQLSFSVPTGNFGDALAGVYAHNMGIPVARIHVATNANDVLHRFLTTGVYQPGAELIMTKAPSQDITVASNFERMVAEVVQSPSRVNTLMSDLQQHGSFTVTAEELQQFQLVLSSSKTTDEEIEATIRDVYADSGIVVDPHTATGIHGATDWSDSDIPMVFLATADHVKFTQPEGVPRDEERYHYVAKPLEANTEHYLTAEATEEDVVRAVKEAMTLLSK